MASWAKIEKPAPISFQEIMSEEIAKDVQKKEYERVSQNFGIGTSLVEQHAIASSSTEDEQAQSDMAIALLLQKQYDLEHNQYINRVENQMNGTSLVGISLKNYKTEESQPINNSDEEEEDDYEYGDWDRFDEINRRIYQISGRSYIKQGDSMVTKHDMYLSGQKNVCKIMNFPPEFETGDGGAFEFQLSNQVFNKLRAHSKNEQSKKQHKLIDKKEDQATAEFGLDEHTRLILYRMINNQTIERVNGVISIGKEAVVIHADMPDSKECVLKVFKTTLAEFKNREQYIKNDHRFKGKVGNQRLRKIINIWATKETHNLYRLAKANIPCPKVVAVKSHVLVMTFIGENNIAAPKLKQANLSDEEYISAYEQVVQSMKALYEKADLVHADLSEYNILWYNKLCYFIDVGQSITLGGMDAFHFLFRDCTNISRFFEHKGVPDVLTAEELFESITGCSYNDRIALDKLQTEFKMKPHLVGRPGVELRDSFEKYMEQMQSNKLDNSIEGLKIVDSVGCDN